MKRGLSVISNDNSFVFIRNNNISSITKFAIDNDDDDVDEW